RDDSIARVKQAKISGVDSTNTVSKGKFKVTDLVMGGNYNFSPRTSFEFKPLLLHTFFNIVEGVNVNAVGVLKHEFDSLRKTLSFMPVLRYGFSSKDFYAFGRLSYRIKNDRKVTEFNVDGGRFVDQLNDKQPIHPHINTFSTLLFRRNYMKLYEKSFISMRVNHKPSDWWNFDLGFEYAQRNTLYNQNEYSVFYGDKERTFTPNAPFNYELGNTEFPEHEALLFNLNIAYWPIKKYSVYNNRKFPLYF